MCQEDVIVEVLRCVGLRRSYTCNRVCRTFLIHDSLTARRRDASEVTGTDRGIGTTPGP